MGSRENKMEGGGGERERSNPSLNELSRTKVLSYGRVSVHPAVGCLGSQERGVAAHINEPRTQDFVVFPRGSFERVKEYHGSWYVLSLGAHRIPQS